MTRGYLQPETSAAPKATCGGLRSPQSTAYPVRLLLAFLVVGVGPRAFGQSPADRFVERIQGSSAVPADARELIRNTWSECEDCDGNEFLTQGLTVLSPKFREALDAYDEDDFGKCVSLMGELQGKQDPFLANNARVFEVKCLVEAERLQEAGERIAAIDANDRTALERHTYYLPEIDFLRGFTLVASLQYSEGREALQRFLEDHPDASQRLVIAAEQMLAELSNRAPESIGEVADLMTYCGRRLGIADTGPVVRQRQDRIVDLLDKLIDEAEQEESQSSSSSSSGGGSQNQPGQQAPNNPMQQSQLPGGDGSAEELRERRRANPAEAWGSMPPAERERILQALRESFPSRYRKLVEQYYEELGKKP